MRRQLPQPRLQLPERRGQLRPCRPLRQALRHQHLRHAAVPLGHAVGAQRPPHLQGVGTALGQILPLQQHTRTAGPRLHRQDVQTALRLLQQQLPVVPLRHVPDHVQPHAAVIELHSRRRTVPRQTPILPFDHTCHSSLNDVTSPRVAAPGCTSPRVPEIFPSLFHQLRKCFTASCTILTFLVLFQ